MIGKNVLFIGAHPDDIIIHAGGTMQKLKDRGHSVHAATMSGLRDKVRSEEDVASFRTLLGDFQGYNIFDYHDTRMFSELDLLVKSLEEVIKKNFIDTVFTHYPDAHQDHLAVHQATLAAARSCDNVILYNPGYSGINTTQLSPNMTVSLDERYINSKQRALEKHESQARKYGREDWIDRVVDSARHYSWKYNGAHGYAEAFILLRCRL